MLQREIATGMPVAIVDRLEVVHIQHQHHQITPGTPRQFGFTLPDRHEFRSVHRAGQSVRRRHAAKLYLKLPAFGDFALQQQFRGLGSLRIVLGGFGKGSEMRGLTLHRLYVEAHIGVRPQHLSVQVTARNVSVRKDTPAIRTRQAAKRQSATLRELYNARLGGTASYRCHPLVQIGG